MYRVRLRVVEVGVADYRQVESGDGEVLIELAEIGAVIGTLSGRLRCLESRMAR